MHIIRIFTLVVINVALLAGASNIEARQTVVSEVTSFFGGATSAAGSFFSAATSEAAGVFQTVTSIAGTAVTIITSEGGQAITLATSGAGVVTSFAGSEYTVATAAISSAAHSGAAVPFDFEVLGAMLMTVIGGALFGAWMTL